MIIHLASNAPPLVRAAADAALVLHIGGASVALVSGPLALAVRKGSGPHRVIGTVFFVAMLAMSSVGAVVAPMLGDPISSLAGAFTFYLTLTGWTAVRRGPGEAGEFELGAMAFAFALAFAGILLGQQGSVSPNGQLGGEPYQIPYVFAGVAVLAASADLSVAWRRGLAGAQRIARHLWRMCLALFIALGSFAGQPKAQPAFLHGSPLLLLPPLIVLIAMIWWLARTLLTRRIRAREEALA